MDDAWPQRPDSTPPVCGPWRRVRRSAWFPLIAVVLALALLQGFVVKVYRIPSASMEPTLEVGDRLLVNRLPGSAEEVAPGDIYAFVEPDSWGERPERSFIRRAVGWVGDIVGFGPSNTRAVVKRVIAVGGQDVECCDGDGAVMIDGVGQPGPADTFNFAFIPGELDCTTTPASSRCFAPFTVPDDELFVLGDNRMNSADSLKFCRARSAADTADCVATVPQENLIGPVLVRVWPLTELGVPGRPEG